MTRIYIDTDELHQISSDLRATSGESAHVISDLWSGFGGTWMGWREPEFQARQTAQCAQIGALAGRVDWDAGQLDVEALVMTAEEAVDAAVADVFDSVRWSIHVITTVDEWIVSGGLTIGVLEVAVVFRVVTDVEGRYFGIPGSQIRREIDDLLAPSPTASIGHEQRQMNLADWLQRVQRQKPGTMTVVTLAAGPPPTVLVLLRGIDGPRLGNVNSLPEAAFDETAGDGIYPAEVRKALSSLPPGTRISFIGHSQGGIAARDIVSDPSWAREHGYTIDTVVTAESPVTGRYVPPPTHAVEFANRNDMVPYGDTGPVASGKRVDIVRFDGHVLSHGNPGTQLKDNDVTGNSVYLEYNSRINQMGTPNGEVPTATYQL